MTTSQIRCLLAIVSLAEANEAVTSKNAANLLGISKPSAHRTVGFLQGLGMIDKKRYGGISLADKGRETARRLGIQKENIALHFAGEYDLSLADAGAAAVLLIGALPDEALASMLNKVMRLQDSVGIAVESG